MPQNRGNAQGTGNRRTARGVRYGGRKTGLQGFSGHQIQVSLTVSHPAAGGHILHARGSAGKKSTAHHTVTNFFGFGFVYVFVYVFEKLSHLNAT